MNYRLLPLVFFVFISFKTNSLPFPKTVTSVLENTIHTPTPKTESDVIYNNLKTNTYKLPNQDSFTKALEGYYQWKEKDQIQKDILTLIDFSLSSAEKRLWIIDLKNNTILLQSFVAHGKNSGHEYASKFSNKPKSHQSSLGFYATGETYFGKHGYSMRLDGLEKGINDNARKRAIVIHSASYVSKDFIKKYSRLGRSLGCPALPKDESKEIIDLIKDKSCLFIYHPSPS